MNDSNWNFCPHRRGVKVISISVGHSLLEGVGRQGRGEGGRYAVYMRPRTADNVHAAVYQSACTAFVSDAMRINYDVIQL